MYLIVGLGNPEEEYARTRHNMGFDVVNQIAQKQHIEMNKKKFHSIYGTGEIEGEKVILLKPQTYMNESGKAIRECMQFFKLRLKDLIVIFDDLDIEPGTIKIRKKGGAGTHNGMKSVVEEVQSENFTRIRIGIGMPTFKHDLLNYILTRIPDNEYKVLETAIQEAALATEDIIQHGVDNAMNKYN